VPGDDHVPYLGDAEPILTEIEEFVTGARRMREPDRILATLLFTDIVGSTQEAARRGDRAWRELLDRHDEMVRLTVDRFRGREVNTTGDGFLVLLDGPARAVQCARAIREGTKQIGLSVRAGLHTGEVECRGEDVGGIAVHVGARVSALASADEILVSSTVVDLVAGSATAVRRSRRSRAEGRRAHVAHLRAGRASVTGRSDERPVSKASCRECPHPRTKEARRPRP
jgi:class 3 adenylate cyclase